MDYVYQFLLGLLFTIVIETIALFFVIRKIFKINEKKIKNSMLLFLGFFCSFSTLPYLWYVLQTFISNYLLYVLIGETLVLFIEAAIYYFILKLDFKKSLLISFICNLASLIIGTLLLYLIMSA